MAERLAASTGAFAAKIAGSLLLWFPALWLDLRRIWIRHGDKFLAGGAVALGAGVGLYVPDGALSFDDVRLAELRSGLDGAFGMVDVAGVAAGFARTAALGLAAYLFAQWLQLNRDIDARRPTRIAAAWADKDRPFALRDKLPGLVLGIGGVGKTTLLEYLSHNFLRSRISLTARNRWSAGDSGFEGIVRQVYDKQISLGGALRAYNITGASECYPVAHERFLWDVAGQGWSLGEWDGLIRDSAGYDRFMIVYMTTYGYSAAIRTAPDLSVYGANSEEIERSYVRARRAEELKALRRTIDVILKASPPRRARPRLTFVNVVNMAGLWWGRADGGPLAQEYYLRDPEIAAEWRRLDEAFGDRLILERYAPASLLFDDMTSEKVREGATGCRRQIFCADETSRDELTSRTGALLQLLLEELYRLDWRAKSGLLDSARRAPAGLPPLEQEALQ